MVSSAGPSPRVLIVDDDETALLVASIMLRKLGYQVETARSGPEALGRVRSDQLGFQGVLLDFSMPGMNGVETLRELRVLSPDLTVLVTSGFIESDVLGQLEGESVAGFLPKPFDLELLRERLQGVF